MPAEGAKCAPRINATKGVHSSLSSNTSKGAHTASSSDASTSSHTSLSSDAPPLSNDANPDGHTKYRANWLSSPHGCSA
jgi:hypothetical protein